MPYCVMAKSEKARNIDNERRYKKLLAVFGLKQAIVITCSSFDYRICRKGSRRVRYDLRDERERVNVTKLRRGEKV